MSVTISGDTGISTIPDDIVTTGKIQDYAVTAVKLDSGVLTGYARVSLETPNTFPPNLTYYDFTNLPAWAKRVTITFSQLGLSAAAHPLIQLGSDSGGISTSGYESVSTKLVSPTAITVITSTSGFVLDSALSANRITGTISLTNLVGNQWVVSGMVKSNATTSVLTAGDVTISDTLSKVRITTTGTDNLNNGTVSLLVEG